ncbi:MULTISPECIES: hydroxyacylglutathione hydrolase [unclassified Methylophaga]|jgi:hydroxyacylglutathione hydrolase|uniref:hydroxyacylglutathione hydrolase n=1 Tax=unclassified Methylophaga TaxID=2629249 RepID=UPI00259C70DB|nr:MULTISPECIES: hydroxyacylglutathione hydrolase [unclassified Methylophaga]|tara:strand:+ start:2038 stop:2808 length:771 start_codon:yes stop_codon:yes gene_type:complete
MLKVHRIPAFDDNYIWLIQAQGTNKAIVVDPGDATPVLNTLKSHDLELIAIFITHHHADHTAGIAELTKAAALPVYGPLNETIKGVTHPQSGREPIVVDPDFPIFTVLNTPGHTPGHISYLAEGKLFCGDTLFAAGCGRLLGGTAEQLHASLNLLASLPPTTTIYCAHEYTLANLRFAKTVEPENKQLQQRFEQTVTMRQKKQATVPSLMQDELATNPFLRCDVDRIKKATEKFSGHPLPDSQAVFSSLRAWKDEF